MIEKYNLTTGFDTYLLHHRGPSKQERRLGSTIADFQLPIADFEPAQSIGNL